MLEALRNQLDGGPYRLAGKVSLEIGSEAIAGAKEIAWTNNHEHVAQTDNDGNYEFKEIDREPHGLKAIKPGIQAGPQTDYMIGVNPYPFVFMSRTFRTGCDVWDLLLKPDH